MRAISVGGKRLCDECGTSKCPGAQALRAAIREGLRAQGINPKDVSRGFVRHLTKAQVRAFNEEAVRIRRDKARPGLARYQDQLIERFADGDEVDPRRVEPRLVEVASKSDDELLFRFARLQWSIPVSAGYGRRLRFLVVDENNGKLIGILGLGDPVFSIRSRDEWIEWNMQARRERLRHVMDAFVLGAVPPYSRLLGGKLVALLATSNEVREAFARKYGGRTGLISHDGFSGDLALITTASALGRSSIYNRLRFEADEAFISTGFTSGSGEFQFLNGLYEGIQAYAANHCTPTAKHEAWGTGWRNRREIIRTVLGDIGLSRELVYHGLRRELFVAPLADNAREFLRGETSTLAGFDRSSKEIARWHRDRWLLPRAERVSDYIEFNRASLRLWEKYE